MSDRTLVDQDQRERFRTEWQRNFAVSANAGSGKTTAISERLAAMALTEDGASLLRKTAVVTFTRKAAAQIGQRSRGVLLRQLEAAGRGDLAPLDHLERAFFGTIHSFCLKLAQTYGQELGMNLNPTVLTDEEEAAYWEEFVEQDPMQFQALPESLLTAFLRHVPLEAIFDLAREMDQATARHFRRRVPGPPTGPDPRVLDEIRAVQPKQKRSLPAVQINQQRAEDWWRDYQTGTGFLPLAKPQGTAAGLPELFARFFAPLKSWLAEVAAVLAGELAERYRAWRFERGAQTYADQIDAAMAVLRDEPILDRIRAEGWRVILDEAQDTDPQQFAVLVEIARPPGSALGTWPGAGAGPRPGHFCLVGDGQQSIYGSRADIANFRRHVDAFGRGEGGELLKFHVTFRAPLAVIELLNASLPAGFDPAHPRNQGLPPEAGAPAPVLQVPYEPLAPGPNNVAGQIGRIPLTAPAPPPDGVEPWLAEEARQVAAFLRRTGPASVGAAQWGDVCVLAPRNAWLLTIRKEFEAAGLKVALQMRKNRNGDHPVYAWLSGLLAAVCDPDNTFEWVGVLREVFAVSDALLAVELRTKGGLHWEEPDTHPEPLRTALTTLRPFVLRANDEGVALEQFFVELISACGLPAKAGAVDPSGGLMAELERLQAEAAELGLTGASPRDWLRELLAQLEAGRPAGKPTPDAVNLLTAHSAKGLEWPVVIPLGLWRGLEPNPERGLRLLHDREAGARVFFDHESLPADTREARERERQRELVRLLYVTLTRARRSLVLPWGEGFGGKPRQESFASLWAIDLSGVEAVPEKVASPAIPLSAEVAAELPSPVEPTSEKSDGGSVPLPARVLPHQLAHSPDVVRAQRHEAGVDVQLPAKPGLDPIDYGLWWHETMEFLPWQADELAIERYGQQALAKAAQLGCEERARDEWQRLRASPAWAELCHPRWTRLAELSVFAPLAAGQWIDGVMDLVLHDATARRVWVIDWKTNRFQPGENADQLLERLAKEYQPQLSAYGESLQQLFADCEVRRWLYASAAGRWCEVESS